MNAERIIDLLEARPFKPFAVYVNGLDEGSIYIEEPKFASLHPDGETLVVEQQRARGPERWTRMIDVALISAVAVREGKIRDFDPS